MRGSCLCGAVRWETDAAPRPPIACHCTQCRKQSGHHWVASQVPAAAMRVEGEVRWFQASAAARRGFCPACGSFLFWQPMVDGAPGPDISFGCGTIDGPTGLAPQRHIFATDKGDYYAIPEAESSEAGWS